MFPGITLSLRRRWRKPIRLPSSRPPCGGSRVCVSLSGKLFEIALGDAGNRACPVIGTLFERRSGGWKSCRRRIPIIYRRNHPSALFAKRFRGRFCCRPGRFGHSVSENYFTANSSIITFIAIFVDDRNHRRFPVRQKHPVN